jgi:RimJ/RimL family protein N-acetyltransferase
VTLTVPGAPDLTLRPATLDDAVFAADMETAVRPQEPQDPVMTRYWWEHPWDDGVWRRYVVERDGRPVGMAVFGHPATWEAMPERWGRVGAQLGGEARTAGRIAALLAAMEDQLRVAGALRCSFWAWEDDEVRLAAAADRGMREARRERFWVLDLAAERDRLERMAEASRARMRDQGIRVLTLAEDGDPERYTKLWRMSMEAEKDIPTTVPHVEVSLETFLRTVRTPSTREDRMWIARRGDELVGISFLTYPPVRGIVETGFTGTARSVRGTGVARALKCETVMQAIALGVDRVQTDNDSRNEPILHINASMGYRVKGEMIQLVKELAP